MNRLAKMNHVCNRAQTQPLHFQAPGIRVLKNMLLKDLQPEPYPKKEVSLGYINSLDKMSHLANPPHTKPCTFRHLAAESLKTCF